ncbi:hypothetical protein BaRGS_00020927 [Batillaria attramentaria]|uniref:Uncharacterized protein n=1 Tax=Batillaria attramentaria TaxID=370345 RepID=A0ABD0KLL5_9CAEN
MTGHKDFRRITIVRLKQWLQRIPEKNSGLSPPGNPGKSQQNGSRTGYREPGTITYNRMSTRMTTELSEGRPRRTLCRRMSSVCAGVGITPCLL